MAETDIDDYRAAWSELKHGLAEALGPQNRGDSTSMAAIKRGVLAIVESVARKYGIPPQS